MATQRIAPRRVAPYLLSGASAIHILMRMRRLSTHPTKDVPLHLFLLQNSDIILVLVGHPIVWDFTRQRRSDGSKSANGVENALISQIAHQLRQVFTNLLLGLGLIKRKLKKNQASEIPPLVERLRDVVAQGITTVNELDPPINGATNAGELITQS